MSTIIKLYPIKTQAQREFEMMALIARWHIEECKIVAAWCGLKGK